MLHQHVLGFMDVHMPPHLLFRSKWFKPRENLKNGDYVIVLKPGLKGQSAPRGLWEHAIVVNTFPGADGRVRKVELRLSGQRKLFRPIHKLCLLATAEELRRRQRKIGLICFLFFFALLSFALTSLLTCSALGGMV